MTNPYFRRTISAALAITTPCFIVSAHAEITEPLGGQPAAGAKPSAADLDAQVAYQRAFEAVVW